MLTISNYSYTTKESHVLSKVSIMEVIESGPDRVKMITKTLTDCQQVCQYSNSKGGEYSAIHRFTIAPSSTGGLSTSSSWRRV